MQAIYNLRNNLLIATPGMRDPHFDHTVTLICQHDSQGAFGVTVNRPMEATVGELLAQLSIQVDDAEVASQSAMSGGPVQPEQGFVLHQKTTKLWDSTLTIGEHTAITSSKDILEDLGKGEGPSQFMLILGCTGWTSGQLESELKENSWLTCPSDNAILFETPCPLRWKGAASTLGIDVNLLNPTIGHA